jgi:hypothetical protein
MIPHEIENKKEVIAKKYFLYSHQRGDDLLISRNKKNAAVIPQRLNKIWRKY